MAKKKLSQLRPQPRSFTLVNHPGKVFEFRKITLEDDGWIEETFGKSLDQLMSPGNKLMLYDLCRIYFRLLADKSDFQPGKELVRNEETGEEREELVTGPKKFMRSIDGGNKVELLIITNAFHETIMSSRKAVDLPENVKKNIRDAVRVADQAMKANRESTGLESSTS